MLETHTQVWEPTFRLSPLAGTPHRRCTVVGCTVVTLDSDNCDCADFANCPDCRAWAENMLAEGCSPWNGLPIPDGETVEPLPEKNFCD
jgi:hypothetical protein